MRLEFLSSSAVQLGVPCITTLHGIRAVVSALSAMHKGDYKVKSLQAYHAEIERPKKLAANAR